MYFKNHFPGFICLCIMLVPLISSLDEIYFMTQYERTKKTHAAVSLTPVQELLSQQYIKLNHNNFFHNWQSKMKFRIKCLDTCGLLQSKFQNTESTKGFCSLILGVAVTIIVAQVLWADAMELTNLLEM